MKTVFAGTIAFINLKFFPDVNLLLAIFVLMVLDFLTGIWKAKMKNEVRTSKGFQRTVNKFLQYAGAIVCGFFLGFIAEQKGGEGVQILVPYLNDFLAAFICFIELASIFENLYEIDSESPISKYFFKPVLSLLTFQIKNNPVVKQANALSETAK